MRAMLGGSSESSLFSCCFTAALASYEQVVRFYVTGTFNRVLMINISCQNYWVMFSKHNNSQKLMVIHLG
jgi:hypothetical protein